MLLRPVLSRILAVSLMATVLCAGHLTFASAAGLSGTATPGSAVQLFGSR